MRASYNIILKVIGDNNKNTYVHKECARYMYVECGSSSTNLFNQINTGQQVHTEIDEGPINTFLLVFFLLQNEHVMVEELLQLLVGEVNTQLLETVVLICAWVRISKGKVHI